MPQCAACDAPATHVCSACNSAAYCGPECQRTHWKAAHKRECGAPTAPEGEGVLGPNDAADLYVSLNFLLRSAVDMGLDDGAGDAAPLRSQLAGAFTSFFASSLPHANGKGVIDAMTDFVGDSGAPPAAFIDAVSAVRQMFVKAFTAGGAAPPALDSDAAAAARIAADIRGGAVRAWGAHGVGRLHGVFHVLGFTAEGALLAEVQAPGATAPPPRVFLVRAPRRAWRTCCCPRAASSLKKAAASSPRSRSRCAPPWWPSAAAPRLQFV